MSSVTSGQADVRAVDPRPESHERPRPAPPPVPAEALARAPRRATRDEEDRTTCIFQRNEPLAAYDLPPLTKHDDEPTDTIRMKSGQLRLLLSWLHMGGDDADAPPLAHAAAGSAATTPDVDAVAAGFASAVARQSVADVDTAASDASIEVTVMPDEVLLAPPANELVREPAQTAQSALAASPSSESVPQRVRTWCRHTLVRALHLLVAALVPAMALGLSLRALRWPRWARRERKPIAALPATIDPPRDR